LRDPRPLAENHHPGSIAPAVKEALAALMGLRWSLSSYACLQVFGFGETRPRDGGMVAEYSLHVQCPWRLVRNGSVICGSFDRFIESAGGNPLDSILMRLFDNTKHGRMPLENKTGDFVVQEVEADGFGGFTLRLSPDYELSVFPAGSASEHWRLFQPGLETPHFVVEAGSVSKD
jgi:hypothetical protein